MRATGFNHVSVAARDLEESTRFDVEAAYTKARELGIQEERAFFSHAYELPDGSVQMYLRDPSGNLVEVDWPDVTTLDRSVVTDLKRLEDDVPQDEESRRSTLFLALHEQAAAVE